MPNNKTDIYSKRKSTRIFSCLNWSLAVVWTIIAITPYLFMVFTTMKSSGEFISGGAFSLPESFYLGNFVKVFQGSFFNYFKNSLMVVAISLVLLLAVSSFAAYPLSRMKFKLNRPIFALIVAAMSIPTHVTLIPMFEMAIRTGLYDKVWVLIGPYVAFNVPVSVFILTAFMESISNDLIEAAEIDGCGKFRTFFHVVLPLSKPGLVTLLIYNGVMMWNEFSFAMVLTQSKENRTLPLSIWEYQSEFSIDIPMIMTVLFLATLPIITLYVFSQDKLIKGLMAGAVKG